MRSIVFLGDVFLPTRFQSFLEELGPYCVNLEAPITRSNSGMPGKINLKVERNHIRETFGHEPLAACLANNHIMDYGIQGFEDTLVDLKHRKVPWFGAGPINRNVNNPLILDHDGMACAFLGYVCPLSSPVFAAGNRPGVKAPDVNVIAADIRASRESGAERVVVSLHWGAEGVSLPRPEDIELGRRIIDLGADLIIGHHAHCIQAWEVYKGMPIFYGLGNCIFPEVEVPQFFEDGQPRSLRKLRQSRRTQRSLAVAYNPASREVSIRQLIFDGKALHVSRNAKPFKLPAKIPLHYHKRYHRAFLYGKYRMAISNFLANPHFPTAKTLLNLISLTKTSRYR